MRTGEAGQRGDTASALGAGVLWGAGVAALFAMFVAVSDRVVNVVSYTIVPYAAGPWYLSYLAPIAVVGLLAAMVRRWRGSARDAVWAGVPLVAPIAVAVWWSAGRPPSFTTLCMGLGGMVWAVDRLGMRGGCREREGFVGRYAAWLLAGAIVLSTVWHALEQVRLWRCFMLGYADFGFFITELEHCLPWKDVGAERFADTRMGYHCLPMFYVLVPFYAIFRSPAFLMVVGPLALNLAAVAFYRLAGERSGSRIVGLAVAVVWLMLPSVSRLPYSNTYGFQSVYLAVPWLAFAFSLGLRGRWGWSHVCLVAALLCEETVCGVALGWGAYLCLWGGRRRDGLWIVAGSIAYLLLSAGVVIPLFAESAQYTRLGLFGDANMAEVVGRLIRPRAAYYLMALLVPLWPSAWRGRRVLVAAVPTLLLVLLLRDQDYLNIKYWHQSSVLVVFFLAVTVGLACGSGAGVDRRRASGAVAALLAGVLCFHYLMGLSPVSRAYQVSAASAATGDRDPRGEVVKMVRKRFAPADTTVMATERLAAHFTDFRMVYTVGQGSLAKRHADLLVVDRGDRWDPMVRSGGLPAFLGRAFESGYRVLHENGAVVVLEPVQEGPTRPLSVAVEALVD